MKILQIAVGIIRNQHNEIFITQRAADAHMANKLEFPGGKIEAGETPEQALIRELQEEVGITPTQSSLFEKLEYQFPDRHITLWFWLVESWEGEPWGKEGAACQSKRDILTTKNGSRLIRIIMPNFVIHQTSQQMH